ncbi:ABC transporter ATP-binding protein [Anthocerotibacter panamensis]|uniref:ABC transporter ATP-binding protein n=1 Tax=Anthocerotibacter panamensis TaxID=2857077 RepID=UPI001FD93BA5|nr:ABC transporter ATP-binding protein [Anthocerotibacter panamensis]
MDKTAARNPLGRLLSYSRKHRPTIIWATVCSVLNKIFDLAPPGLNGAAVDVVVNREHSLIGRLGFPDVVAQLWILAGATLVIWALESVFEYAYELLWRNLAQTIEHEMRLDAYSHIQDLEMAYFEDRSTGGLLSILNDDINQLERFLDGGANDLIQVATTVLVVGGVFFFFSPPVALLAMLPMPLILWGSFVFQKRLAPRYATVRERVSLLNSRLANNLSGIATIKSFTAERYEREQVRVESDGYRTANGEAIRFSSAFVPVIRMVIVLGFTATLVLGGWLALAGQLAVGAYSVLIFLTQRLLWPLTSLGKTVDLYERAMASVDRVMDVLDTQAQLTGGTKSLPQAQGEVTLEGVDFAYQAGYPVLRDLSLCIPAQTTVGIVGATGSGKSTLVKLLLRFYDPTGGRICFDGVDLRDLDFAALRGAIGLVSQDVFLFHGTVRENIAYGSFTVDDARMIEAARMAEAHEFILRLPQGYDTVVGERGQKLSGGQRQRLSIARALLKNPPVLILDEATSAVDNETEAAIQRSLERIAVGRTTIVIAHRLSTVRNADQILVLEEGRLRESGQHEELLRQGGVYAALWAVQTGEPLRGTRLGERAE